MMASAEHAPKVSIVMATYNRVDLIGRALDSIAEQDYPNLELVIADGASTDGTRELLESRSQEITSLTSEPDQGIYDAWNKALARITGDWVLFLGADDRYTSPHAVSDLVEFTRQHPDATLITSRARTWDEDTDSAGAVIGLPFRRRQMKFHMTFAHPASLTHRSLIDAEQPFRLDIGLAADYEFYLRKMDQIVPAHTDLVTVYFSLSGGTSTELGRTFRSTRRAQIASGSVTRPRAALQYAGFYLAWPIRTRIRSIRGRRTT